jgi:hypothetical protein
MKKTALLIGAILLAVAGFAGAAYAAGDHQPTAGTKLIGYGPYGYADTENEVYYTAFTITIPDCVNSITIDRMSIVRGDGTPIYEGPVYQSGNVGGTQITSLLPHQVVFIRLVDWLPDDVMSQSPRMYTVEVSYSGNRGFLAPIGHVIVFQENHFDDGTYTLAKTRVPMEDMKQPRGS